MKRAIAILLLLTACSSEEPASTNESTATESQAAGATAPPPSAEQARAMIEKSSEFSQHEFTFAAVSLPVSGAAMNEATRAKARQLADAGWLSFDGANDIMLTEKSRRDKRFILRENGLLDVVPLAKKEMGTVEGVRANPDGTVSVDFNWKWVPNEVGQSFKTGPEHDRFAAPQKARAGLIWNGTEWVMLSVETR